MKGRRFSVRSASFLAAAFLVVGGFAVEGQRRAAAYRVSLQNSYQHSFAELTTNLSEMNTALQKGIYSSSPALLCALCTQVYGKAMAAQLALGELPFSNVELEQTADFVAKAGDYAMALSQSAAKNIVVTEEEREMLRGLSEGAARLSAVLEGIQSDLYAGAFTLEDVASAQRRLSSADGGGEGAGAFETVESDFPEIPSLIYDGPFSEHLSGRTPKALASLPEVGQDEARAAAADFLGLRPEIFSLVSAGEGDLPTWGFSAGVDGGELYVEVTRQGGMVLSLFTSRAVTDPVLSRDEAVALAASFLAERGFPDMESSYTMDAGNILTANFAHRAGEVFCYPDLIKVSVALDNGRIVGLESRGYLMNHAQRALSSPTVSADAAREKVSPDLEILSHQLALIPSAGEHEVLTHEFKCQTSDGRHVIVYINAQTGLEEKILLLLEDESGTLAI